MAQETKIKNFYDLEAWQKAKELVLELYKTTIDFPNNEIYGIISQIRRAGISIPANIAEGFGRYFYKDKIRFYYQARGSLSEIQCLLIIAKDLGYLNKDKYVELFVKSQVISRLIWGLIRSIENNIAKKG